MERIPRHLGRGAGEDRIDGLNDVVLRVGEEATARREVVVGGEEVLPVRRAGSDALAGLFRRATEGLHPCVEDTREMVAKAFCQACALGLWSGYPSGVGEHCHAGRLEHIVGFWAFDVTN